VKGKVQVHIMLHTTRFYNLQPTWMTLTTQGIRLRKDHI